MQSATNSLFQHQKKIRILFICHDGKIYGSQNSLRLIVGNLPPEKYQIFVSFSRGGPLADIFKQMPNVTVLFHKRLQGVKHSHRNFFKRIGDIATVFLNAGRVLQLVWLMQLYRIDLVHTNSLVSLEGGIAAQLAGVPHIWHIRELFDDYNPRFHLILGKKITKAIVHNLSTEVLCISNYVRQQFQPYILDKPKKYRVLYNAIASDPVLEGHKSYNSDDKLNLLYLGRISDGKRFQDIINAFVLLKQQWQDQMPFYLKAYGDFICKDFKRWVYETINKENLSDFIEIIDYQQDQQKCFEDVSLLLMPSSTEAFGRIMLEALVRGIPVVASRSGAPLEVIEEGESGFFHTPNDAADLAECLNRIYEQRNLLPLMRAKCLEQIHKKFDVTEQIYQLESIYQDILEKKYHRQIISKPCLHPST